MNPENIGGTMRRTTPSVVVPDETEDPYDEEEQRVAITLSVGDGFKFGCGLILAAISFYFVLIIMVAAALLLAEILNLPLPFGLSGR